MAFGNVWSDDEIFEFDDQFLKDELDGIPLSEPEVLSFIRNELTN